MGDVTIACLACGHLHAVPEGSTLRGVACPKCGTPAAAHFPHEKMMRFEAVESEAYARACEHARRGDPERALAALEEAVRGGYDDFERIGADPAFATLRADPRFREWMSRSRSQ
jgi:predicted  nucleic acid-binding Zn-ribbon protein